MVDSVTFCVAANRLDEDKIKPFRWSIISKAIREPVELGDKYSISVSSAVFS